MSWLDRIRAWFGREPGDVQGDYVDIAPQESPLIAEEVKENPYIPEGYREEIEKPKIKPKRLTPKVAAAKKAAKKVTKKKGKK